MVGEDEFEHALYTIDIGQNDFAGLFTNLSYEEAIAKIPDFVAEIKLAIWVNIPCPNISLFSVLPWFP